MINNYSLDKIANACFVAGMTELSFIEHLQDVLKSVDNRGICCVNYWNKFSIISVQDEPRLFGLLSEIVVKK